MGKLFKFALGFLLIGIGLVAVFSILSENNLFASINEEDFTYYELVYDAADFDRFDFDFQNRKVTVRVSEDDQIRVTYYTTEKDMVTVSESDGELKLLNDVPWYDQLFMGWNVLINSEYYQVNMSLPASVVYDMSLVSSNGAIDIQGLTNLGDVYASTSIGKLTVADVTADALDLSTSYGGVYLTNLVVSGDLVAWTSYGPVHLTSLVAASIDAHSSHGKIIAQGLDSEAIELGTSNGDVEAEVVGAKDDYEVRMSTSNGHMTYDGIGVSQEHFNSDAPYRITLDTPNGDIDLTFTE